MLSEVIDLPPPPLPPPRPSSYFSEEIHFPAAERKIGFWNSETMNDHIGVGTVGMSQMLGSQSVMPSGCGAPANYGERSQVECQSMEMTQPCGFRDRSAKLKSEQLLVGDENLMNSSVTSWRSVGRSLGTRSNIFVQPVSRYLESNKVEGGAQCQNALFSSSLSDIFSRKLRLPSNDVLLGQSVDAVVTQLEEEEPFECLKDIEAHAIGNLLPDEDDLLPTRFNGLEGIAQPSNVDNIEDFDLFSSVGGMELEGDDRLRSSEAQGNLEFSRATSDEILQVLNSSSAGKHPYGEHPSRTLFVRNINSNIEDSELKVLFEQYGDIRTLYTACKHRGFVIISYYDIRAACNAMNALQNKLLRRRKLDIHFSIPKENLSEKDINQGILVVFNLDLSVSNDELHKIFGIHGEIKEIHETLGKHHHKFIEFYDVRDAEAALRALNGSDIARKRIKIELSHPGHIKRFGQQVSSYLEQEELGTYMQQGSAPTHSSLGCIGPVSHQMAMSSSTEEGTAHGLHSAVRVSINPLVENLTMLSPSIPKSLSSVSVAAVSNQYGLAEPIRTLGPVGLRHQQMPVFHPHSLPDRIGAVSYDSPCAIELGEDDLDSVGGYPLRRNEHLWHNSNSYHSQLSSPSMWHNAPSVFNGMHSRPPPQLHGFLGPSSQMMNTVLPLPHHHVRSSPSANTSLWDRRHANYAGESHELPSFTPVSLASEGFSRSLTPHPLELASPNLFPHANRNYIDPSLASSYIGFPSPQRRCHMFPDRNSSVPLPNSYDSPNERFRSRRNEASPNHADNKKQYELDINRIVSGEDLKTTLMIKNIPNKYTSKMLLAAIDERHHGTYDFIYLPIDFKNKCNVGYAFINMTNPLHIIPFYKTFDGKKWEKFNSEKVASLAYARIQGKAALITHFQNSSLMNEDKRCRPILFHSDGPNAGDQEPFPMGINIRTRTGKARSNDSEENLQGSPSTSNEEESSNGAESSSGSSKASD
ncbi:hypothetical protein Syun_020136 [Stephania yunnanensis]|uniref:RRM domain-containing protein n=1 Tax=Stephania yunnanensis TaxID=152371 RepID=A0AAP0IDA5_9MAGN